MNKDPNKIQFEHNLDDILNSAKKLKVELDNLSRAEDGLHRKMDETNRSGKKQSGAMDDISSQAKKARKDAVDTYEDGKKKIKDWLNTFREARKEMTRSMGQLNPIDTSEFSSGFNLSAKSLFGFGSAIKSAFSEMKTLQGMRHEMAYLADASGSASKAVGTVFNIAKGSAISRATSQGVVRTLADQGLALTDAAGNASPKIERLGKLAGDLQAVTGIAASQWGSFTGELSFNYGLTESGIQNITSALVGTGLRAQHLERAMSTVNKVMQTTAYIAGVPTDSSMNKLTKSIGGAMKAFQKLGISAEKAGSFIEGIVDPENFEKNSLLFSHLGISAGEYAETLNDVNGQQKLLEKVMGNLPSLAQKLSSIQNPFARMEMAKTLGLDMQTVRRMASASKEDIEKIMKEYEEKNKADEALAEKKKKMDVEAAKWDDMIWNLKMQVLQPVMKMLSGGYLQKFMGMLPKIANAISEIFKTVSPIIEGIVDMMVGMIPAFQGFIKSITNFFSGFTTGVKETLGVATDTFSGGKGGGKPSESAQFWGTALKYLAGAYAGIKVISIGMGLGKGVYTGFKTIQSGLSILFGNGSRKKVMNATLGDLQRTIKGGIQDADKGPSQMGMGSGLLGSLMAIFSASWFMKKIYDFFLGESSFEDLKDKEKVLSGEANGLTIAKNTGREWVGDAARLGMTAYLNGKGKLPSFTPKLGSMPGAQQEAGILSKIGSKIANSKVGTVVSETISNSIKPLTSASKSFREMTLKWATNPQGSKLAKFSGFVGKGASKLGPAGLAIGAGVDVYGALTGTTRAERWGAIASLGSTITGGIVGAFGGPGGALIGAQIGQVAGTLLVKPIVSAIGGYYDKQDTLNAIKSDASFKMVEQFRDVAEAIKEKGNLTTTYEEKLGKNFDYSKTWDENEKLFEKEESLFRKKTNSYYNQWIDAFAQFDPEHTIDSSKKRKLEIEQLEKEKKLAMKQFEILKLKNAYNKGDRKNIEEQLKIIKDKMNMKPEEFKQLEQTAREERKVDYSQNYGVKNVASSMLTAWQNSDMDSLGLMIELTFKKLKRKLYEGISGLFGEGKRAWYNPLGWGGDDRNMGQQMMDAMGLKNGMAEIAQEGLNNAKTIETLKKQITSKGGKVVAGEVDTVDKQEAYIMALNEQLGKLNKNMREQTKAIKDQTGATNANTEAQKEGNSPKTKTVDITDYFRVLGDAVGVAANN